MYPWQKLALFLVAWVAGYIFSLASVMRIPAKTEKEIKCKNEAMPNLFFLMVIGWPLIGSIAVAHWIADRYDSEKEI